MKFENICTQAEADFLLKNLKHTDKILEWGSGQISLQIASKIKHACVITHDLKQYGEIIEKGIENINALYIPVNKPQQSDDGTFDEFKDYIHAATELRNRFGKFDVIIIRGRARVECAKFCEQIAQENCKVFIQDFNHPDSQYLRSEYFEAEKHLTRVKGVFTMYLFEIKEIPSTTASEMPVFLADTKVSDSSDPKLKANKPSPSEALAKDGKKPRKVTELPKTEQKRVKDVAKKIFKNK